MLKLHVRTPVLIIVLILALSACNRQSPEVVPTDAPEPTETEAPNTIPETVTPDVVTRETEETTPAAATGTPHATFTPLRPPTATATRAGAEPTATRADAAPPPTETTAAPATPTATRATPTDTATEPTTGTPGDDTGSLTFVYDISWELPESDPTLAIATVTVTPSGGTGQYTYYHDNIQQEGPIFTFEWRTCQPKPGSIRVESGSRSAEDEYFAEPPCPATFTPEP